MRLFVLLLLTSLAPPVHAQESVPPTPPRRAPERAHARSMVISTRGIVATSQVLASQAGAMILAKGGSAVDAAIAANAVLGLVEPMMDGIGGDLFVLYRDAKTGALTGLNSSGPAPRAMTIEALQAKGLQKMASNGIHSATVPGCVRGWEAMHKRYGKLLWKDLFTPAIQFAEEGFPVYEMTSRAWDSSLLRKYPETTRTYLPNGKAPATGEIFRNPGLARAMRSIANNGADSFYKGEVARAILATSAKLGGTLAAEDLSSFEPQWVTPVSTTYRGWKLHELPPNGQGLAALTMLNILETFQPGPANSATELHRKIEAMKLAYSDLRYVADPLMIKVPTAGIISKDYGAARAKLIDPARANCDVKAGTPPASDTTYFSVVDREGNIASWIQSVSGGWGSGITVEGMGFILHNRGSGFQFDKSHPNALAPGKRPFHTIIPAIVEHGDDHIAFGIMGGPNQPLAHAQYVSYLADYGLNLQAALEAPRFTKRTATGCDVTLENRFGLDALTGLSALGHQITIAAPYTTAMGRGNAVRHNSKTKINSAASDPRTDGAAIPEP
ncbi:MAG: gamma-glutamyltransferase [Acidobacteriota bacterium]